MALIDELKEKRDEVQRDLAADQLTIVRWNERVEKHLRTIADLDKAISALTPPQKEDGSLLDDQQSVTTESNSLDGGAKAEGEIISGEPWEGAENDGSELVDEPSTPVENATEEGEAQALDDAIVFGTGFVEIIPDGSRRPISAHEYYVAADAEDSRTTAPEPVETGERTEQHISVLEAYVYAGEGYTTTTGRVVTVASGCRITLRREQDGTWLPVIPDGWTRHAGGQRPIPPDAVAGVMFESGRVIDPVRPFAYEDCADFWHWPWDDKSDRIIAYGPVIGTVALPDQNDPLTREEQGIYAPGSSMFTPKEAPQKPERSFGSIFGFGGGKKVEA